MRVLELLQWQWDGYPRYHSARANLLIHIVVVPVFLLGNIGLVLALTAAAWWLALLSLAAMLVSVALQGRGHRTEQVPAQPFTGAANAIGRIFLEQWVNFPRFVATGAWLRALRQPTGRKP